MRIVIKAVENGFYVLGLGEPEHEAVYKTEDIDALIFELLLNLSPKYEHGAGRMRWMVYDKDFIECPLCGHEE